MAEAREFTSDFLVATMRAHHAGFKRFIATEDPGQMTLRVERVGDLKRLLDMYAATHMTPTQPRGQVAQAGDVPALPAGPPPQPMALDEVQKNLLAMASGEIDDE